MIDFSKYLQFSLETISSIPKSCGIYCFRNNVNNKCYIGQAINIRRRVRSHFSKINDGLAIHKAILKYGINGFSFYIIENDLEIEMLNDREIFWISFFDSYNNGYNMTPGGNATAKRTEEVIRKLQNTSSCKKIIAYNYKYNYYLECKSTRQLARIFKEKHINISAQNIYDARLNKSYSKDFIFGETVSDIQYILKTKKLPKDINIYLYHIPSKKYSSVFHSSQEATMYIRSFGYKISDSHIKIALTKNNRRIKDFIIADSEYLLEDRINSYHPYIYGYNVDTGKVNTFKNATEASKITGCCYSDVCKCIKRKQLMSGEYSFGYSEIECKEKAVEKLEKIINRAYAALFRRGVMNEITENN